MQALENIKSGETVCYYEGITGRAPRSLMAMAGELHDAGKVVLTQRKLTDTGDLNIYQYLAEGK